MNKMNGYGCPQNIPGWGREQESKTHGWEKEMCEYVENCEGIQDPTYFFNSCVRRGEDCKLYKEKKKNEKLD
jgi:hypothetical protein